MPEVVSRLGSTFQGRVRGAGLVVLDPAAEQREDGFSIPRLRAVHIVPFNRRIAHLQARPDQG